MEVHIVHYKKEYGSFKNAQSYSDGVCVVGFFGEVIIILNKYFIDQEDPKNMLVPWACVEISVGRGCLHYFWDLS